MNICENFSIFHVDKFFWYSNDVEITESSFKYKSLILINNFKQSTGNMN